MIPVECHTVPGSLFSNGCKFSRYCMIVEFSGNMLNLIFRLARITFSFYFQSFFPQAGAHDQYNIYD